MGNNTDDRSYTDADLDAILAEFASYDPATSDSKRKATPKAASETPRKAASPPPAEPVRRASYVSAPTPESPHDDPFGIDLNIPAAPVRQSDAASKPAAGKPQDDPFGLDLSMPATAGYVPAVAGSSSAGRRAPTPPPKVRTERYSGDSFEETFGRRDDKSKKPVKTRRDAKSEDRTPAPTSGRTPPPADIKHEEEPSFHEPTPPKSGGILSGLLCVIFMLLSVIALGWTAYNVHPSSDSAASSQGSKLDLMSRMDVYMNNSTADALGDLAYIKKIYKIDENETVAPMPDQSKFATVSIGDAAKVMDVVQQARDYGLLDDQEVLFNPDIDFVHDSTIQYYCDETILVICWKELINGNTCSMSEVKIADPSQFRRKISDDTYGSSSQYYATTMYKQVNAVVAMNSDNYTFRQMGIIAYQRQLYRFNTAQYTGQYSMYNCLDNCFITAEGNFLFMRKGERTTAEEVQQFMVDNNVLFSISFGPVLVDDGVVQTCDWYPCGEYNTGYSRAGIGQLDELHYLYMSLNHSNEKQARWTVNEFAQHFAEKGVIDAYNLDGGQTGEVVFNGEPFNYMDYGNERLVSDIIYFATAIPAEEVTP